MLHISYMKFPTIISNFETRTAVCCQSCQRERHTISFLSTIQHHTYKFCFYALLLLCVCLVTVIIYTYIYKYYFLPDIQNHTNCVCALRCVCVCCCVFSFFLSLSRFLSTIQHHIQILFLCSAAAVCVL